MDEHSNIAAQTMAAIYNRRPRGFQVDVIPHLLKMLTGTLPKQPVLMVQPTGAGKSIVPLTTAVVDGGVTLIIENTLALGTDQASKVELIANSNHRRYIKSLHLDSIKGSKLQRMISKSILNHCNKNIDTSFIIFSSPETLLKTVWTQFFIECGKNSHLNLICIDEIHMFVEFGCTFRPCFQLLFKSLFSKFRLSDTTSSVPFLLMTATFNKQFQSILEKMIGFTILQQNTFWAKQKSFMKRHIDINLRYSTQHFRLMKEYLIEHLEKNSTHKAILVTNTAQRATQCQHELNNWLDTEAKLTGDSVLVIGDRDPELKFAYTVAFTNTKFDSSLGNPNNKLQPRFLIGTSGCIGAGLDCHDVHLVLRFGLSTNIINFIQEMGRCGRSIEDNSTESNTKNEFNILFSIHDFVYIHKRIHDDRDSTEQYAQDIIPSSFKSVVSHEDMKLIEHSNFIRLCTMMFLNVGCWHYYLEMSSANPDTDPYDPQNYDPCLHHCPYCTNKIINIVKVIDREQLCIFLAETMTNTTKTFNPVELGDALYTYPDSGVLIYKRKHGKKPHSKGDCYMTIIQLILADIVRLLYDKEDNNKSYCILPHINAQFNYANISYWRLIRHI